MGTFLSEDQITHIADAVAARIREQGTGASLGRWLTVEEAMKYARVKSPPKTIYAWIEQGLVYAHKRTGRWIIDRESIDDWFLSDRLSHKI